MDTLTKDINKITINKNILKSLIKKQLKQKLKILVIMIKNQTNRDKLFKMKNNLIKNNNEYPTTQNLIVDYKSIK